MTPDFRMAVFALIATSIAAPIASGQQAAPGSRNILEFPDFVPRDWSLQIAEVGPGGSVRIEADGGAQPDRPALAKGYYLLAVAPERIIGYPLLFRARVEEVAGPNKVAVTVGPGAAGKIEAGRSCALVRPPGVAEDRLRTLPDVIPCGRKPPESPAEAEAANLSQSTLNLKLIGLGLANYESSNGSLPPAAILGPDGKPWHSWRVLLLPFIEQMELYQEYDFSEPWDGPKNRKLIDKMPDVYRDPIHGDAKGHDTHYAVLVGEWKGRSSTIHTAFPPSKVRMKSPRQTLSELFTPDPRPKLAEATDGPEKTIAVVPVSPDRKIPWTKPEDIAVGPEFPGLGKPGGIAAPYRTGPKLDGPRAAPVLMRDFFTKIVLDTIDPKDLRALTTRDGGPAESLDLARVPTQPEAKPNFDPSKKPTLKVEILVDGTARAWAER
jgi:Protein of unknown function (DUF1559)